MQEVEEREGGLWAGKFHLMMFHRLDKYHWHAEYTICFTARQPEAIS
jgi:hypothetical protein